MQKLVAGRGWTRRHFTSFLGFAGAAACGGGAPEPDPVPETAEATPFDLPLGAQLYTLRSVLPDDPRGVLEGLAKIGYTEVEVLQLAFAEQKDLLAELGLKPVSMHLDASVILGGEAKAGELDAALEMAAEGGLSYAVMPWVGPEARGGVEMYKKLAESLQAAGEKTKALGMEFAYHNHAFEYEPMEGTTPLEILLSGTDAETVQLELDLFWVRIAGEDPVAELKRHAGRVPLLHLKDPPAGREPQYHEKVEPDVFREVGNGSIDFAAVLQTAQEIGVKHYFVEQDQTPGDPLESLTQSYEHLRGLRVG